jgi:anti-anti-sigma regulatory factor
VQSHFRLEVRSQGKANIIAVSGDSTGLSVLVRAHQRAEEQGRRLAMVKGPQQVQRLLSLTGVADRLTLVDRPEELLGED